MTQQQIELIALNWLKARDAGRGIPWHIASASTRQTSAGWLVFYAMDGFIGGQIPGNAPLLVGPDGAVRVTGTSLPLEAYA